MNKRFALKNKLWVYIVSIAVSIILLACCVVNILQLCEVGTFKTYNKPLTLTSTILCAVISILSVIYTFCSGYTLTKKGLLFNIGIFFSNTPYEKILKARTNSDKTILIIYVECKNNGDVFDEEANIHADIFQININPNKVNTFIDTLKEHNKNIIFEVVTPESVNKEIKKDKEDKK